MGQWVASITGYDTSGPGLTTKVFAMGPGLAFTDAAYAPGGFVSWVSRNQHVDVSREGGVVLSADAGQLVLQNLPDDIGSAGPLDALAEWSWQNRVALLYWISDGTWANRQLVDVAVMEQPVATLPSPNNPDSTLTFVLRDPRAALSVPLQPTKFLGSNTGGTGVEGEADLTGKPKPILYGTVSNIPGVRVNASLLIYQVADVSASILCVRDGGAGLAAGTARGSLASMLANSPTPGSYDTYAGSEGTFVRLGSTPIFQIGIDAQEGTSGSSRTNIILQSVDFTTTWSTTNMPVTSNAVAAPDSSLTGDNLIPTVTNGVHSLTQTFTAVAASTYVASVYLRAAGRKIALLRLGNSGETVGVQVTVNLATGAIFTAPNAFGGATLVAGGIQVAGNGWYRVWIAGSQPTVTTLRMSVYVGDDTGNFTFAGDAVNGISAWGAQAELGSVPTQYVATGAAPVTAAGMSGRTHAQIWSRFRQARCGNVSGDINATSVTNCDTLDNNEVGFWWADETTCLDAMNEILTSLSGYEVQGFDLKWSINKLVAPSGTTQLDFVVLGRSSQLTTKQRPITSIARARPGFAPDGAPPYQVIANWGRAYQTFVEADFAGVAPQRLRDKFKTQYRAATATDTTIWNPATATGPWLNAPSLTVNTAYQPGCDGLTAPHALAEAGRLLALYGANKAQYQISFVPLVTDQVSVGAIVSLTHPQMALAGGPKFVVLQSKLSVTSEVAIMSLVLGFQT